MKAHEIQTKNFQLIRWTLFLLILLSIDAFSQISLTSEKFSGNIYTLEYLIQDNNYKIENNNGRKILQFDNIMDESHPGQFNLPSRDIFIAIPYGKQPSVKLNIVSKDIIKAFPFINPFVSLNDKRELCYESIESVPTMVQKPTFEIKGYLWIGDNYCIHLNLNIWGIEKEMQAIYKLTKIQIVLDFHEPFPAFKTPQITKGNALISNSHGAGLFLAKPQFNSSKTNDWINNNLNYMKMGITQDGIYRISYADLLNTGLDPRLIDPVRLKILNKGKQIPIYVHGENDGKFDENDFIEFVGIRNMGGKHRVESSYGEPYNEYLDRYSDTSVYWLNWEGDKGLRVKVYNGKEELPSTETLEYYNEIIHVEKNNWFDFSMADQVRRESPFWYENKTWNEGNLGLGTRSNSFIVRDVYKDKPVYVFSKLQDYASNISQKSHLLAISLNNQAVQDSDYINKYQQKVLKGIYNSNVLAEGNNVLKIHSFKTQASINTCIFDWYEIEYPRYIKAINDTLSLKFPFLTSKAIRTFKISNLKSDSISVWKYEGSFAKYDLHPNAGEISVTDTMDAGNKFYACTFDKILKPTIYYLKRFVNLSSSQNQADYIAITHKKFINKAREYAEFIATNYNKKTIVVDVDDIYDEFSYGYFNPESIRDFLKITHTNWILPYPEYVNLIGAATYDYHHNKTKFMNQSPTYNYVPSYGASVSDNWFVIWDSTGAYIPQMNIGRLPINTAEELDGYLLKHKNYANNDYDEWNKKYIFFSGGTGDNQSQLDQLRSVNQYIIDNVVAPMPIGGSPKHFYKTITPKTNFGPFSQAEIQKVLDQGAITISYLGHSGTRTWDNSITEPSHLNNKVNRAPLITDFGCSTARFAEPDVVSFSQLFVTSKGGQAIAYIGNASLGFLSTTTTFPQVFYKKLLVDSLYTISKAHREAKLELVKTYGNSGVFKLFTLTNTLIGDPIVTLPIPLKPNLSISAEDIKVIPEIPTDSQDSILIKFFYYNTGRVNPDTFALLLEDHYTDSAIFIRKYYKTCPSTIDSLMFYLPVKGLSGIHRLKIILDCDDEIKEINESDNTIEFSFSVLSSSFKNLFAYDLENSIEQSILLLNPALRIGNEILDFQFSTDENFINNVILRIPFGTYYSKVELPKLDLGKRYWFRTKVNSENTFGQNSSFILTTSENYLLQDMYSFNESLFENTKISDNKVVLDTTLLNIGVLSAGFLDGKSVSIIRNGQEQIPESTLRGHHICVFDENSYELLKYKVIDLLGTGEKAVNEYIQLLDGINEGQIVAIGVMDEGSFSSQLLKDKLKTFGSMYIDSLMFRGSWAMIGKRGALPGSIAENYTKPGEGSVRINTTFYIPQKSGSMLSSKIGPSAKWNKLYIKEFLPVNTGLLYKPIGIKENGQQDTLHSISMNKDSLVSLSHIDAKVYPYMKILAEFTASPSGASPSLKSLGVNYDGVPELGLNYQVVHLEKDTIDQGDDNLLNFYVYNAGESAADSVKIRVAVVRADNSQRVIYDSVITKIDSMNRASVQVKYLSNVNDGHSTMAFLIQVDPDNKVLELYKDNNNFKVPFFIRPDTTVVSINEATLKVMYDGQEILDGDYISSKPQVKMTLEYPVWFPYYDTSAIKVEVDNKRINFSNLSFEFDTIKRTAVYTFLPELSDGEHILEVFGNNVYGNLENMSGYRMTFNVANEAKALDVYNYPNPTKGHTNFTFKLTRIPEELRIKIYTVAGRLIREIKNDGFTLRTNFNYIPFDCRDQDGNELANGVYIYKVILRDKGKSQEYLQKLAVVR